MADSKQSDKKPNTTVGPKGTSDDNRVDKAMEDSFPASDPPAHTGVTGPSGDMQAR